MSKKCNFCGKKPVIGNNVSHANNKTKRIWYPNLKKIKIKLEQESNYKTVKICTRCLRSKKY